MAQYCAAGFRNKKSTKVFFKLWCKHFYALHTLLLWESQKRRLEPNILTWCCAAYCRPPFPQSLPRFFSSDRRICAKRKEHPHLHSAVSASGIFTPFLCALRQKKRKAVFRNMPIFCFRRISSTEIQLSPFSNHLSRACGINNSFGIIIFCETHILFFVASICLLFQFISCNTVFIKSAVCSKKQQKPLRA